MALPLVAFSFGGIESTTIAAFEARSIKDISRASSSVHWFTIFLYILYTVAVMLVVKSVGHSFIFSVEATSLTSSVVHAVDEAGYHSFASFINGFFLYSVLSCGNTAIYMASRTLYGLASNERLARRHDLLSRWIQYLGMVNPVTGVPLNAIIFSWLILCWVPMLGFAQDGNWQGLAGVRIYLTCLRCQDIIHRHQTYGSPFPCLSDQTLLLHHFEYGIRGGLGCPLPSFHPVPTLVSHA